MSINLEELNKLRKIFDENPQLSELITGRKQPGRKAGKKLPTLENTVLEVEQDPQDSQPIPISLSEAKKIVKQSRKPKQMTEETRQRMLEVLAKGREKAAKAREEKKILKAKEEAKKVQEEEKKNLVKRYIVKPKQKYTRKEVEKSDVKEETTDFDETSESELSDVKIMREIQKKKRILKKIEKTQLPTGLEPLQPYTGLKIWRN